MALIVGVLDLAWAFPPFSMPLGLDAVIMDFTAGPVSPVPISSLIPSHTYIIRCNLHPLV